MDFTKIEPQAASPSQWRGTRRRFIKYMGEMAVGAAVLGIGAMTYMAKIEPGWIDVVSRDLTLPHLQPAFAGFRLAHISDIHISDWVSAEDIAAAVDLILENKPDLVAITGDFLHRREKLARFSGELSTVLRVLTKEVDTVAVLGNHDYWVGTRETRRMLQEAGVRLLVNQSITLQRGKSQLHIVGVDDVWDGLPRLRDALRDVPEAGAAVLLAHEPDYADVSAKTGRFDLQISGHSHGGQVVLPVFGPPIRPYLAEKYPLGLYQVGRMFQYTNRGLGMTRPYIRFNCRPEITLFNFQPGLI